MLLATVISEPDLQKEVKNSVVLAKPFSICVCAEGETWASPEPRGLSFLLSQFIRPTLGGEHCWASSLLWKAAPADSNVP